jgi:hypothetical protein
MSLEARRGPYQAGQRRNRPRRLVLALLYTLPILVLTWQLVAEAIEPHYSLALFAWLGDRPPPLETPTIGETQLRLYADARPHVGKITSLQKGLVWVASGRELIEEGYGFGLPLVEFDGLVYCARYAEIEEQPWEGGVRWVKRYHIDTVDTPIRFLRRKYRPVEPLGVVTVIYDITHQGTIAITVDMREVAVPWRRVYLMNEQGAQRFTLFADDRGRILPASELGIWQSLFAESACFAWPEGGLGFCVQPTESPVLYYGRERYLQYNWRGIYYLSWSGVDIQVEGPRDTYQYTIQLEAP